MRLRHLLSLLLLPCLLSLLVMAVSCGGEDSQSATGSAAGEQVPTMTTGGSAGDTNTPRGIENSRIDSLAGRQLKEIREENFVNVAKDIVNKLARRDSAGLSQYVHPVYGLYLTYSVGVQSTFKLYQQVGFSVDEYPLAPFYDGVKFGRLEFAKDPEFDCGTNKWSREGTFTDSTRHDSTLTKLAVFRNRYFEGKLSKDSLSRLRKLELLSRRIIVASNDSESLIFSLTLIDRRWWLTIIDKNTMDCSA